MLEKLSSDNIAPIISFAEAKKQINQTVEKIQLFAKQKINHLPKSPNLKSLHRLLFDGGGRANLNVNYQVVWQQLRQAIQSRQISFTYSQNSISQEISLQGYIFIDEKPLHIIIHFKPEGLENLNIFKMWEKTQGEIIFNDNSPSLIYKVLETLQISESYLFHNHQIIHFTSKSSL